MPWGHVTVFRPAIHLGIFTHLHTGLSLYQLWLQHCCQIPPGLLGQFSQKNSAAGEKIRPQAGHPPNRQKSAVKHFCYKFLGQFLPIIVKIRPQLGNLELGRFLGRWLPRPQEILLGRFWVQRPWIQPSGTSGLQQTVCLCGGGKCCQLLTSYFSATLTVKHSS